MVSEISSNFLGYRVVQLVIYTIIFGIRNRTNN